VTYELWNSLSPLGVSLFTQQNKSESTAGISFSRVTSLVFSELCAS